MALTFSIHSKHSIVMYQSHIHRIRGIQIWLKVLQIKQCKTKG